MIKLLFLTALAFSANAVALKEINSKPPSRAKNFKEILGEKISIAHLFDTLSEPSQIHRFLK